MKKIVWKSIMKKIRYMIKQFIVFWILQFALPITSFLVSHLIPSEYKNIVIIIAFATPILIILPISIVFVLRREIKKMKESMRIYKAVYQSIMYDQKILDEYHHIKSINATYKIKGSDVWLESRAQGVNVHSDGKISKEIKLLSSSDIENYRYAFEVYDNIRDKKMEPESERITENTIIHKIHFPPTKVGQLIDYTNKRFWAGGITKKQEYIYASFRHLLKGIDLYSGAMFFDRVPITFSATTITPKGNIEEIDISLEGEPVNSPESCYKLKWEKQNPPSMVIINFILPKPTL